MEGLIMTSDQYGFFCDPMKHFKGTQSVNLVGFFFQHLTRSKGVSLS